MEKINWNETIRQNLIRKIKKIRKEKNQLEDQIYDLKLKLRKKSDVINE